MAYIAEVFKGLLRFHDRSIRRPWNPLQGHEADISILPNEHAIMGKATKVVKILQLFFANVRYLTKHSCRKQY